MTGEVSPMATVLVRTGVGSIVCSEREPNDGERSERARSWARRGDR